MPTAFRCHSCHKQEMKSKGLTIGQDYFVCQSCGHLFCAACMEKDLVPYEGGLLCSGCKSAFEVVTEPHEEEASIEPKEDQS